MAGDKILVLYDNRSERNDLQPGWGFSALIEIGGHRVLFDTGADKLVLEHNAAALGVDLSAIDTLVLSHEHCDHIGAISSVLHKDLDVFYPASFSVLFKGEVEEKLERAPWHAHVVSTSEEIVPGITSTGEMGKEIVEQALIISTSAGPILITGCAHPGIVGIARVTTQIAKKPLSLVIGGFHLYKSKDDEIKNIVDAFRKLGVQQIGPCHCTGERAIVILREAFGPGGLEVMAGTQIAL